MDRNIFGKLFKAFIIVHRMEYQVELKPDYIKLDHYFGFELSKSEKKQEMVKSIVTYCQNTKTNFVLEGIEFKRDLMDAKGLNVASLQSIKLRRSGIIY